MFRKHYVCGSARRGATSSILKTIVRSWLGGSGAAGNYRPTDYIESYDAVLGENCVFFVFCVRGSWVTQ